MRQRHSVGDALSSNQKLRRGLVLVFTLLLLQTTKLQSPGQSAEEHRSGIAHGSITGRVVTDDGQPLINVRVSLGRPGSSGSGVAGRIFMTDEDGSFKAEWLRPGAYTLNSGAPGYFAESQLQPERPRAFYHPGDAVTLVMIRGGVITGRVTNALGEPVAGLNISAMRVRDVDGGAISGPGGGQASFTDDRGVYRIYGLPPGAYLVYTGSGIGSAFDGDAPTYYLSATRDSATEVLVHQSEEISGIDIQHRDERGHTISGTIAGANLTDRPGVSITLTHVASRTMAASTFWSSQNGIRGWALKGLADGEYEVTAQRSSFSNDSTGAAALPRRVTVRGADVTGLELTLTPLAAISGKVLLESASVDPARQGCDNKRAVFLEETILNLQRDEAANEPALPMGMSSYSTPDSSGEFSLRNLKADRYWFEVQLPHENVYLRAITLAEGTAKPVASNVARDGITLKSGERLTGLTIILAEGAAGVKGKVIAAEGATLPSQLRVYLVPAEKEAADEVLRYAETGAGGDGAFTFSHLAPGRYWMLAHAMPPNKSANNSKPVALNDAERVKLRKEAAAAQVTVELQSCQRVVDYGLKYNSR